MDPAVQAWRIALDEAERSGVTLAALGDMGEATEVSEVVRRVWGEDVIDAALVKALGHAGGTLYGAREANGALVGFVLGFMGWDGGLHVHSHMLAVLPDWEARGIGFALKLAQRAATLDHGIEEVRWTYDPLVARNARFNLVKLGAVATRLLPNFYGEMHDALNRDDRSDRFEVIWRLSSERVLRALRREARPPPAGAILLDIEHGLQGPIPKPTGSAPAPGGRVRIPPDHLALRTREPELGRRWRDVSAQVFQRCFEAGLEAVWMSPDGEYTLGAAGEQE